MERQRTAQARALLERYVEAKDLNRPALTPGLYSPEAVLTFSIATDEISFPGELRGIEAITRTLISDFGKRFVRCKTYYVCEVLTIENDSVPFLPWLVLMREGAARTLRVGKGFYRWQFEPGLPLVRAMHISIARMAAIPDPDGNLLDTAQQDFPYPWLEPDELRAITDRLLEREPSLAVLSAFREPVAPNECAAFS